MEQRWIFSIPDSMIRLINLYDKNIYHIA